ncbi:MAG: transcription initiation factor E subunit alpha [Candidatus Altiarchaeales archaeon]|nr:MAG: transcription initiation factor E subunit alpha [Candidatus Altiarchaeales archaeon]RLI93925.1 MAG: transcription initiation factor E subunit alpha [Candidatus Altiarchaeales archaeon]RLI94191.1 MAG: transcription initiation factor E subunit alpha [Candidatus Altiarchaeales archaeon]
MNNGLAIKILEESMSPEHVIIIQKLSEPKRDDEIATELGVKETVVRTLLNDLHAKSLVEYERTRNDSTGWYTYTWKRRDDKIDEYIRNYLMNKLKEKIEELEREKNGTTFTCACSRVSLEKATEYYFVCPECHEMFVEFDNSETIKKLESEIARIRSLLKKA